MTRTTRNCADAAWAAAGDWVADRMHGRGVYKYSSGKVYDGMWEEDRPHGKGQLTDGNVVFDMQCVLRAPAPAPSGLLRSSGQGCRRVRTRTSSSQRMGARVTGVHCVQVRPGHGGRAAARRGQVARRRQRAGGRPLLVPANALMPTRGVRPRPSSLPPKPPPHEFRPERLSSYRSAQSLCVPPPSPGSPCVRPPGRAATPRVGAGAADPAGGCPVQTVQRKARAIPQLSALHAATLRPRLPPRNLPGPRPRLGHAPFAWRNGPAARARTVRSDWG